jgi:hypothetical protein
MYYTVDDNFYNRFYVPLIFFILQSLIKQVFLLSSGPDPDSSSTEFPFSPIGLDGKTAFGSSCYTRSMSNLTRNTLRKWIFVTFKPFFGLKGTKVIQGVNEARCIGL